MSDDPIKLRFGDDGRFEIDEAVLELRDRGEPIPLEPKPFALLLSLVRHRDRVVRREELFETLWPGVVVSDHALSRAAFKVRKALGEEGRSDGFIQTLRGSGLRFAAPIFEEPRRKIISAPRSGATDRLIGREAERVQLSAAFAASLAGRGGLALIEGEPGIGKTRLAQAIAAEAENAGAFVHWARASRESGAPAFWLWRQVLRGLFEAEGRERIERWLGAESRELARVLPDIAVDAPAQEADGLPEDARFRIQEALAQLVLRSAREELRVFVLEDLQWADRSSLHALAHVVSAIGTVRVLIVGTARDGVSESDPTAQALADVASDAARNSWLRRVALRPLAEDDVAALFEARSGLTPPAEFTGRLLGRTDGNPYFVSQLAAVAAEATGEGLALDALLDETPPALHAALRQRLEALSPPCREALTFGAVIGREFPITWVARASEREPRALVAAVGEAVRARVVERAEGEFSYRFCHDLQREVILGKLGDDERAGLHLRIGEAIRSLDPARLDPVMPALAHHFIQAAPLAEGSLTIEFAKRAGELARDSYAFEEAAVYFHQAHDALAWVADPSTTLRAELLVGEGFALQGAGRLRAGRAVLEEAASVARNAGSPTLFAVAAMGSSELAGVGTDPEKVRLLEEALEQLGEDPGSLRVWLLSILALHQGQAGELDRARSLAERAVEAARSAPRAWLSLALSSEAAVTRLLPEGRPEQRLHLLDQSIENAQAVRAPSFELLGAIQRYGALIELARREEAEAQREDIARLIERTGSLYFGYVPSSLSAGLRVLDGDFAEAERLTHEAFDREDGPTFAAAGRVGMLAAIRYQQGRMAELLPAFGRALEALPELPALRAAEVGVLLEAGEVAQAEQRFALLAKNGFGGVVGRESWVFALCLLAESCCVLGDRVRAKEIAKWLAPRAGDVAILAHGHYVHGPVALFLALLDHLLRRLGAMGEHLDQAAERSDALGSPVWRASTLAARSALALERDDPAKALQLARETFAHVDSLGLAFSRLRGAALEAAQR